MVIHPCLSRIRALRTSTITTSSPRAISAFTSSGPMVDGGGGSVGGMAAIICVIVAARPSAKGALKPATAAGENVAGRVQRCGQRAGGLLPALSAGVNTADMFLGAVTLPVPVQRRLRPAGHIVPDDRHDRARMGDGDRGAARCCRATCPSTRRCSRSRGLKPCMFPVADVDGGRECSGRGVPVGRRGAQWRWHRHRSPSCR